ncbi:MAG: hypothetical protein BTN85_0622 [Candidatus Methanohalarchaeum thermophilum]|uniref:Uncharacterized protein n=1 Tax=Methanohalarchaeum thermophilum TaxID=1903181 RepID=A0A1Q6DUX4_METT1|nr:MAG: hypothetical protein BTN85_0622 [Candidatus Methanohalarchaeum thermophilum]
MVDEEKVKKLLSKLKYMYYKTELDGREVEFEEFLEGLSEGESFKGVIHTETEVKENNKIRDGYILIDEGEIKLVIFMGKDIYYGSEALDMIKNPDKINYTRLKESKKEEILKKARDAGILF